MLRHLAIQIEFRIAADEAVSPTRLSHRVEEFDIEPSWFFHFMGIGHEIQPFLGPTDDSEEPGKEGREQRLVSQGD